MKIRTEMVDVTKISHHPINSVIYLMRFIAELAKAILGMGGLLDDIILNEKYQILSGNRRFEAILLLGWTTVQCKIIDIPEEEEVYFIIGMNAQRVKTIAEVAHEIKYLKEYLKSEDATAVVSDAEALTTRQAIAETVGYGESYVSRIEKIMDTDVKYLDLIDAGELTINKAYQMAQKGAPPVPQPKQPKKEKKVRPFFCDNCPMKEDGANNSTNEAA